MHRLRVAQKSMSWTGKAQRYFFRWYIHLGLLSLGAWSGLSAQVLEQPRQALEKPPQALELPPFPIDSFTLANGLRVYVNEDHSSPTAAVSLWVHAGRAADPTAGGLAHVLEHLLALETPSYPVGSAAGLIRSVGGRSEATSDLDRTAFMELVPSERLNLALAVQADRLRPPPLLSLVWNGTLQAMERELRTLARQPFALEQMMADTLATRSAAYRRALAWRDRLGQISGLAPAVVADFHAKWFAPSNAVLTIVGDVDAAQVRNLVEEYFGHLRRVVAPPAAVFVDGDTETDSGATTGAVVGRDGVAGPHRIVVEGTLRGPTLLWVSYGIPDASDSDRAALSVLSTLLSGGETSRLYRRLVQEQRLVESVAASLNFRRGPGTLIFGTVLARDVDPDLAESLIVSILEEVAAEGVDPADLVRAKHQRATEIVSARLTPRGKARLIQRWALFGESWNVTTELEALQAVRELDLVRVSAMNLTEKRRAVVRVDSPGGERP
jgi:zinc protease